MTCLSVPTGQFENDMSTDPTMLTISNERLQLSAPVADVFELVALASVDCTVN